MRERYVVDTNVLIAASAGCPTNSKDIDATPDDPQLRLKVWVWLSKFQESNSRLVLDTDNKIYEEYNSRLGFNDFGLQMVIHKWSTAAVDNVEVLYDVDGYGILPESLRTVIHDNDDKKMVAAAVESHKYYNEGCIAFASDTDWHDWESELYSNNILVEPIIEEWSREKHAEKQAR